MNYSVKLVRLSRDREVVEEITETFSIFGGTTYRHPNNKKGMIPIQTTLGKYVHVGTKQGDYRRWYISDTINHRVVKYPGGKDFH